MSTLSDVSLPRSYLFVPANRADRIDKALASGAGAVIVDLEDAIAPEHKLDARATFAAMVPDRSGQSESIGRSHQRPKHALVCRGHRCDRRQRRSQHHAAE